MKKFFFFSFLFILTINLSSQNENRGLCTVDKIKFKEVYVLSEPVRPFDIVGEVYSLLSQLDAGLNQINEDIPSIKVMIDNLVDNAITKEQKGKVKNFDAIITNDGYIGYLIKFKEGNEDKTRIGRVKQILGKDIYLMCTPLNSYNFIGEIKADNKQITTAPDQSIETFMKILIENAIISISAQDSLIEFDGLIANECNKAFLIKYK